MKSHDTEAANSVKNTASSRDFCRVRQRKERIGGLEQSANNSIAGLLPGVPPVIRQKVQDIVEDCVMQVFSAMASVKDMGIPVVFGTGINRVTRNADEYLLVTQNGKVVPLKDLKMDRLFLMYVGNRDRQLTIEQIRQAELVGHWKLAPDCNNGTGNDEVDDEDEDNRRPEFNESETVSSNRRASLHGVSREQNAVMEKSLHLAINPANRDMKQAIRTGAQQFEIECIRNGKAALREKLDELIKARYGRRTGPEMSKSEKAERSRIQMAVAHVIDMVAKKDEELARHLDISMARDGRYGYFASPRIQWAVCDNLIEAAKQANASIPVRSQERSVAQV